MKKIRLTNLLIVMTTIMTFGSLMAQEKNFSNKKGVGIVAHRGFWNCDEGGYAKNSIASLKAAQDAGFWGSEFDVNMTADEKLIVFHDDKIDGKAIDKNNYETFKDVTLSNGEKMPTLDEYLTQGKKSKETVLVYELKKRSNTELENRFVDLTIESLKKHKLLKPSRVIFISFSKNICERLADKLPKSFTIQYLGSQYKPQEVLESGINGIDFNYKIFYLNPKWISKAKELGMSTNSWTVNKEKDITKIIDMGIDYITSDYPLLVRDILKSKATSCCKGDSCQK